MSGTARERLPEGSEWNEESLRRYDEAIGAAAAAHGLECYPHELEIITAEQMMDAYASIGLPVYYHHWSFGKHFLATERNYKRGQMGLAYEIVINSDPCIAYLMEENTLTLQAIVIAHAAYGHNSFFRNNYLFRLWTAADTIIDYMLFARNYIADCEERYGQDKVERLLDACHALANVGVDRYKRSPRISLAREKERQRERVAYLQSQVNDIWRTLPPAHDPVPPTAQRERFVKEPEENLLYFLEKNAPFLESWQREIIRIVRKIGQYFFPQRQTQVMNEGWATFWHYTLLNDLYDQGRLGDGFMLEFLQSHSGVILQPPYNARGYGGINPYTLGFSMWRDIRRICETPTDEDRAWFPDIAGSDWHATLDFAMRNFKDESFIAQYLSPQLMRELRLFCIEDDDMEENLRITAIHDEAGYLRVRRSLSEQYNLGCREPDLQVWDVDMRGDRALTLRYATHDRQPLAESTVAVLDLLAELWGFAVRIESLDENGKVETLRECRHEKRRYSR